MNNQKGFTLIELVVVIVILGILSAFAAPKFLNLQDDAYEAKFKAVRGSFKAGISMVHAKSLVSNTGLTATRQWLDINGNGTTSYADGDLVVANSWPNAVSASECRYIFNNTIDDDVQSSTNATLDFQATLSGGVCTYTDTKSGNAWKFDYTVATGAVTSLHQ